MLTLKSANKILKYMDVELHKGNGYHYFTSNKYNFKDSMVMVSNLNSLTLHQWVREAEEKIKECE
jgi:hypothetical protein